MGAGDAAVARQMPDGILAEALLDSGEIASG
jgi:hypothetical protein